MKYLSIFIRVALLALGQSLDCHSASEVSLMDMGKSVNVQPQQSTANQKPCAYFLGYTLWFHCPIFDKIMSRWPWTYGSGLKVVTHYSHSLSGQSGFPRTLENSEKWPFHGKSGKSQEKKWCQNAVTLSMPIPRKKSISPVEGKLWSGKDFVYRWTDGQMDRQKDRLMDKKVNQHQSQLIHW